MQASRCSTGRAWPGGPAPVVVIAVAALVACAPPPANDARRWMAQDGDVLSPDPQSSGLGGSGAGGATPSQSPARSSGGSTGSTGGGTGGFAGGQGGGFGNSGGSGGGPAATPPPFVGTPPPPADPILPLQPFTPTGPPGPCNLAATVTTVTFGSDYSPSNIGAIWIADTSGKFIKTLAVWASRRMRHLEEWMQVTTAAGVPRDTVDAVTGSTARSHTAHVVRWNCTDSKRMQVPRGAYRLCMEMTEYNGPGPKGCIQFENDGTASLLTPPDIGSYKARVLDYKPQ
jgi:hypothetical protein